MSEKIVRLKPGVWPSQPLAPEAVEKHLEGSGGRADENERLRRSRNMVCLAAGAIGTLAGLLGIGVGGYIALNERPPPPMAIINPVNGDVLATVGAKDAPRHFTADTSRQYLRMFVMSCGGYDDDVWRQAYKECMQLLGPDARKVYHAGFTASNAGSPQNVFGKAITAIPENLRFEKESDAEGFQRWTVRYDRVEYRNGQRTKATPMNVDVRFEWRPEMIQTQEERAWNTAGMRVASYNFYLRPGQ